MIILLIFLVILLLILSIKISFIDTSSSLKETGIMIRYIVPVDNILLSPLLYLVDPGEYSADYFNKEHSTVPPSTLTNNNNEYYKNLLNLKNLEVKLATKDTNPRLPEGISNNYTQRVLSKGDKPYLVVPLNGNTLLSPLLMNKKYVLGVSLQLDKEYINIKGVTKYKSDPFIKYRYTKFNYIDLVFNNNKLKQYNDNISAEIINGNIYV